MYHFFWFTYCDKQEMEWVALLDKNKDGAPEMKSFRGTQLFFTILPMGLIMLAQLHGSGYTFSHASLPNASSHEGGNSTTTISNPVLLTKSASRTLCDKPPTRITDISGVPIVNYSYVFGEYVGLQRNPVTISQCALDSHLDYKQTGDETQREILINNSNWLANNAVSRGNYSVLEYNFPWPEYNLTAPWLSAMAQGQAIQALVKAHEVTNNNTYLETAKKLLNSFFVEVEDGGVTYKSPNSGWWYEEYAGIGGKEPRVLNGMMWTLIGIYSYYNYTNDPTAKFLFDQGILSLKNNLNRYEDKKYSYSYYDILKTQAPLYYHRAHLDLLDALYKITNENVFVDYYQKWLDYKTPPYS